MLVLTLTLLCLATGFIFFLLAKDRENRTSLKQIQLQISQIQNEKLEMEEKMRLAEDSRLLAIGTRELEEREHQKQMLQMERYRLLVEDTDEFLFETNYKGQFLYANPVMLNRLGYGEDELAVLSYDQLVLPENQKQVFQFYHKQYHERQADSYAEWQVINRFGEEVWVGLRVRMTFDLLGRIASVKGIARDLSIQRTNERQSQEQINQFEDIFKLLPNPVLVFKKTEKGLADAFLTWTNQPALKLMNLDWFEVAGLRMEDVSSKLVSVVNSLLNSTTDSVAHWSPKTNRDRKFEVQSFQSKQTILVLLTDVTESGSRVQHLENERDFFKMIADELPFDIAVFTADERFKYVNKSAVKSEEVRQWMIGKTDTDYMKFRQKELFHALLRRLRFNEVRAAGSTIRFDELFVDGQNQLLYFVRNLKPVFNKETEIEHYIAAGFNYSDLYLQTEPDRILADQWLFQSLWFENSSFPQAGPDAGKQSQFTGLQAYKAQSRIHGGHFQLHAETLPNLEYQLRQLQVWPLQVNATFGKNRSDIYMIPRILIEETLKVLGQLSGQRNPMVQISCICHFRGETRLILEIRLQDFEHQLPELQTICKIWTNEGFQARELEGKLWLEAVLEDLRKPITDQSMREMQLLKRRKILVGPEDHPKVATYTSQLQQSGAEVSLLSDLAQVESFLSSEEPDLIVWWGKSDFAFDTSVWATLKSQNVKILFYDSDTEIRLNSNTEETISTHPEPQCLEMILEHIWLLAKETSFLSVENEDHATNFEVKFTKLAEITDGDTVFTTSLIRSYIISLQECQDVFAQNLEVQDKEGLKFLLHKIRATIKTFEIKSLELVIREAIDALDGNKPISVKRKKDLSSRLRLICGEASRQIDDYAKEQNLKV